MEHKITYLDRNEYNFEPAPEVIEALNQFDVADLCFYSRCFQDNKKSILSDFIANHYHVKEQNVILGYGGEDILKQAVHCFLASTGRPKKLLVPQFSWWYYKSIADEVDGITVLYPIVEEVNRFSYDVDKIKSCIDQEQPDILLIASPNNPTGNTMSDADMHEVLSYVPEDTLIIIDEAYFSFASLDDSHVKTMIETYSNLLIVRTFSKFYGLPGLRLGFAFMGERLVKFRNFSTKYLGYNRISEYLGIAALKATDYYNTKASIMQQGKQDYSSEIGIIPGFTVYESDANFVLVKYPIALKEQLQQRFKSDNYVIKFMNEPGINCHLRITLGTEQQNRAVIEMIKEVAIN